MRLIYHLHTVDYSRFGPILNMSHDYWSTASSLNNGCNTFQPQTLLLLFHNETFVVHVGTGDLKTVMKVFSPSQFSKDVPDI